MNCLVCHEVIRISRLQELFSWKEPLLCISCQNQLIPRSSQVLYEQNPWLNEVIKKLNQGDICLNQIFFRSLSHSIKKHVNVIGEIVVVESSDSSSAPYPWLEILVTDIRQSQPDMRLKGEKTLFIGEKSLLGYEIFITIS